MKSTIRLFSACLFILILWTNTYAQNHLIAYYQLNGNTLDMSGNSNHATNNGATATTDRFGNASSAMHFNGSSAYIACPDDFDFQERTICMWFKTETFPTDAGVIYTVDHNSLQYGLTKFIVSNEGGVNKISLGVASNVYFYNNALPNIWYHAAMSISSSYIRFYINGVLMDSTLNDDLGHSASGASVARIGTNRILDRYFEGVIDEVLVYDRALTTADILWLYTSVPEENSISSDFRFFPSPAENKITIEVGDNHTSNQIINILDFSGRMIREIKMDGNILVIDISELTQGTYLLKYQCEEGIVTKKFIKI